MYICLWCVNHEVVSNPIKATVTFFTQDTEEFLSNLVLKKTIYARMDRPAGVITFRQTKDAGDVLNEWSTSLNALMMLVSKATHLIHKEEMVHGVLQ